MGLAVVVLTIAMDPFSQQLLQLRQHMKWTEGDDESVENIEKSAKIFWSWTYEREVAGMSEFLSFSGRVDDEAPLATPQIDLSMEAAILNALSRSQDPLERQSLAVCPTGNCTWPTFSTLGVCHRCSNLTSQLQRVDGFDVFFRKMWSNYAEDTIGNATAYVLPKGHLLANVDGCRFENKSCAVGSTNDTYMPYYLTAYNTGDWKKTITLQDVNTLITSMSVIYVDEEALRMLQNEGQHDEDVSKGEWPDTPVAAWECGLYFCVKEINKARMERNELFEAVTEAKDWRRVHRQNEWTGSGGGFPTLEYNPNNTGWGTTTYGQLEIKRSEAEQTYGLRRDAYQAISYFFNQTFRRTWGYGDADLLGVAKKLDPNIEHMFNGAVIGKLFLLPKRLDAIWNAPSSVELEGKFDRIATSMTNVIRSQGSFRAGRYTFGHTGVFEIAYSVVWPWFALHATIIGGSVLFCVTTMVMSRSVPVWKSHSLATMSQGPTVIDFGPEAKSLVELENRAKSFQVSLAGGEKGQLLCKQDDSSTRDDASSREENVGVSTGVSSLSQ